MRACTVIEKCVSSADDCAGGGGVYCAVKYNK